MGRTYNPKVVRRKIEKRTYNQPLKVEELKAKKAKPEKVEKLTEKSKKDK